MALQFSTNRQQSAHLSAVISMAWDSITNKPVGALTSASDTNVTIVLGGGYSAALLQATSITLGWTGTLAASRGGFGVDASASSGVPLFATGVPTFTGTTGSGTFVRSTSPTIATATLNSATLNSPTLVTAALGSPLSGVLTNCTGLPVSTGISGLGSGISTWLTTPNSANLRAALTDETGTGSAVFATSPTLTTPNMVGTSTNDTATAGSIGEFQRIALGSGSAIALTSGAAANILSLSLTAGDWEVGGNVVFLAGTGAVTTEYHVCTDIATATVNADESAHAFHATILTSQAGIIPVGVKRYALASTTTVYLNCTQTFSGGTLAGYGTMWARRMR